MKKHIVHVIWLDAGSCSAWTEVSDIEKHIEPTHSVGFLIFEDADIICLALTYDHSTKSVNATMNIPKCCVKKVRRLCQIKIKS